MSRSLAALHMHSCSSGLKADGVSGSLQPRKAETVRLRGAEVRRARVRQDIGTVRDNLETLKGLSAEPKGWTGNKLLYESCMRLACV